MYFELFKISSEKFSEFYRIKNYKPCERYVIHNKCNRTDAQQQRNSNHTVFFDFINRNTHNINQEQISRNHRCNKRCDLDNPTQHGREPRFDNRFEYRIIAEKGKIHNCNLLLV